jgi:hypothetical protein
VARIPAFFSRAWWRAFRPARTRINTRERLRLVAGSLLGIFVTGLLCHLAGGVVPGLPWLVAPLGASAVLIFAVPASPMAQPWTWWAATPCRRLPASRACTARTCWARPNWPRPWRWPPPSR